MPSPTRARKNESWRGAGTATCCRPIAPWPPTVSSVNDGPLRYAAGLYAAGLALHTADHLRRGIDVITTEVLWLGNLSTAAAIVVIVMVFTRHRLAAAAAVVLGFSVAIGVAAVHLLPHWSTLSDAFPDAQGTGVTAMSWAVVLIEIVGAFAMGVAGVRQLSPQAAHP